MWLKDMTHSVHSRGSLSGLWAAAQYDVLRPHAGGGRHLSLTEGVSALKLPQG